MSAFEDSDDPDRPLTEAERQLAEGLSFEDRLEIDRTLLERLEGARWRKVAFIVAHTLHKLRAKHPGLPDVYYGLRVRRLVTEGRLENAGNLARMRFSEVRLPATDPAESDEFSPQE